MILQVVTLVDDSHIFVIVITIVSSAIDHVCDANLLKRFSVLGHEVSTKIEEVVYDLRTDALVEFVFVLFATGTTVVKVFVVKLLWGHNERRFIPIAL